MERSSIQLELDTLLHSLKPTTVASTSSANQQISEHRQEDIASLILNKRKRFDVTLIQTVFEPYKQQSEDSLRRTVVVRGADLGEFPTEYAVHDLCHDELPVIGTYVHPWITPGFKYRVRVLGGRSRHLFGSNATYLRNIGRGYGKRITFEGESLNYNTNYFYSDSNQKGFGFSLVAVQEGDNFIVCDNEGTVMGQGTVRDTGIQKEITNFIEGDGGIVKHVAVTFVCEMKYGPEKHGLVPLCSLETVEISGTSVIIKPKHSHKAFTKTIENVILPNCGSCVLKFSTK